MSSPSSGSVSLWLQEFKAGNQEAFQKLFGRYFEQLVALARVKFGHSPRRVADEEDVALSAFHSFCGVVERQQYKQLDDRKELWSLLFKITERKALDQLQRQARQKRGGGTVRGDSAFLVLGNPEEGGVGGFEMFESREPTPADAAELADLLERLFDALGDPQLRRLARMKLDGYQHTEIAKALGCSLTTIERRLAMIRTLWEKFLQDPPVEPASRS